MGATYRSPLRRSVRLRGYDYSSAGAYSVTLCTHLRECFLADINETIVTISEAGQLVEKCWLDIPDHFKDVTLDEFIVMPNHVHGIIIISGHGVGATHGSPSIRRAPPLGPKPNSLPAIIATFKGASGKRVNLLRDRKGAPVWQRNYYEHVIRNEADMDRIRDYIQMNPFRWLEDEENPSRKS